MLDNQYVTVPCSNCFWDVKLPQGEGGLTTCPHCHKEFVAVTAGLRTPAQSLGWFAKFFGSLFLIFIIGGAIFSSMSNDQVGAAGVVLFFLIVAIGNFMFGYGIWRAGLTHTTHIIHRAWRD